jgi:hypothetical protein
MNETKTEEKTRKMKNEKNEKKRDDDKKPK